VPADVSSTRYAPPPEVTAVATEALTVLVSTVVRADLVCLLFAGEACTEVEAANWRQPARGYSVDVPLLGWLPRVGRGTVT